MLRQMEGAGLDEGLFEELIFMHPTRKFRFDFCWPHRGLALEVQGGIYSRGRHARPRGMINDMTKFSEAAIIGWRLLLVTGIEISNGQALDRVLRGLKCRRFSNINVKGLPHG